jgi:hypothetical protein
MSSAIEVMNLLFNSNIKHKTIDPFVVIVKLAILGHKLPGTKLKLVENDIKFDEPGLFQGVQRFLSSDKKQDLHNLMIPIYKACEWYIKDGEYNRDKIDYIFKLCIKGIIKLRDNYLEETVICQCFTHYINMIESYFEGNFKNVEKYGIRYDFYENRWNQSHVDLIYLLFKQTESCKNIDSLMNSINSFILSY